MVEKYELVYTRRAVKDIRALDAVIRKRLKKAFEQLERHPFRQAKKLVKSQVAGEYRVRVGNYRIIFDVDGATLTILRVQHRREVYER